jgi:Arc/MetJ family transcription regulator
MPDKTVLEGPQIATPYIVDSAPLAALRAGERFESTAIEIDKDVRAQVQADAAFKERKPLYGLAFAGVLYGVTEIAEAGVRELLKRGGAVAIASERTADELSGFSGVKLYLPERDAFDTWGVLEKAGLDVAFDADVRIVNLNTDDVSTFENGRVSVSIAAGEGTDIALTVTQGDATKTWQIYAREHHTYETLQEIGSRTVSTAVIIHHDSFTQHGSRYYKLYLVL